KLMGKKKKPRLKKECRWGERQI
ncbi:uncharacterized protein METZ01_LOCUS388373, partial [marine metagenome]